MKNKTLEILDLIMWGVAGALLVISVGLFSIDHDQKQEIQRLTEMCEQHNL